MCSGGPTLTSVRWRASHGSWYAKHPAARHSTGTAARRNR